jgi:hypothetical protein
MAGGRRYFTFDFRTQELQEEFERGFSEAIEEAIRQHRDDKRVERIVRESSMWKTAQSVTVEDEASDDGSDNIPIDWLKKEWPDRILLQRRNNDVSRNPRWELVERLRWELLTFREQISSLVGNNPSDIKKLCKNHPKVLAFHVYAKKVDRVLFNEDIEEAHWSPLSFRMAAEYASLSYATIETAWTEENKLQGRT